MSKHNNQQPILYWLLLTTVICVCVGRGYQCLFWDIPIRSLLWNEDLMTPFVNTFLNLSWDDYLIHSNSDAVIQGMVTSLGVVLILLPIFLLVNISSRINALILWVLFFLLTFIALLYHLEKFKTAGQFFEYSLQFMSPILLLYFIKEGISSRWKLGLKITIALTFISHGLYALGFYPVPGNFVAMTIEIMGCNDSTAKLFLQIVGVLDIVFSIGLFLKGRLFKISLYYCVVWGLLTALARIVANVDLAALGPTLHQWVYESIYRVPHFLLPFILILATRNNELLFIEKE